ncbi:phosphonoacetate hydrolase [Myxococcota bacterium]|nr:phosphonoacetate hydrolase [Myxococcota bacterium]
MGGPGSIARIAVHGRWLAVPPPDGPPRVAICLDGSDPAYLDDALDVTPTLASWRTRGAHAIAEAAVPTFTNPNNVSIVTGAPPSEHGICGNHFFDPSSGVDVPMNERRFVRGSTILEALTAAGVPVLVATAKHKLLRMLDPGAPGLAVSAEVPGELGRALVPDVATDVYSAAASLWVLDAGLTAIERGLARVIYLSTTDYVQHKHAPGSAEARAFYAAIDERLSRLDALGVIVALTADHGMSAMAHADGSPNVVFLRPVLDAALTERAHVTLPITDPYVVHHGALGGCAMVYVRDVDAARSALEATPGVEAVLPRVEAARRFALPVDRIGDLVVFGAKGVALGKSAAEHDLTHVAQGLRSHGSLHERAVPFVSNRPLTPALAERARTGHLANRDLFTQLLSPD